MLPTMIQILFYMFLTKNINKMHTNCITAKIKYVSRSWDNVVLTYNHQLKKVCFGGFYPPLWPTVQCRNTVFQPQCRISNPQFWVRIACWTVISLGKTHIFFFFFFSGRTTKVLPSLHQWLSGPCHFFFFFFQSYNSLKRILNFILFFPIFGLKQPDFRKKSGFLLSGQGGLPSLHPQWSDY